MTKAEAGPETSIGATCNGCAARELEGVVMARVEDEDAVVAAGIFKAAHARAKELLDENPGLVNRHNILAQQLGELGPQSDKAEEQVIGAFTFGMVTQSAVNCAVMQVSGTCRILNPLVR